MLVAASSVGPPLISARECYINCRYITVTLQLLTLLPLHCLGLCCVIRMHAYLEQYGILQYRTWYIFGVILRTSITPGSGVTNKIPYTKNRRGGARANIVIGGKKGKREKARTILRIIVLRKHT